MQWAQSRKEFLFSFLAGFLKWRFIKLMGKWKVGFISFGSIGLVCNIHAKDTSFLRITSLEALKRYPFLRTRFFFHIFFFFNLCYVLFLFITLNGTLGCFFFFFLSYFFVRETNVVESLPFCFCIFLGFLFGIDLVGWFVFYANAKWALYMFFLYQFLALVH